MLAESMIWGGLCHCDIKVDLLSSLSSSATLFPVAEGGRCSVTQSCPALCNPKDCSMPGFPVIHYLLEFAQTHVLWIHDAIQPSHPLLSSSPPAFNLSPHQGNELVLCLRWLELQLQYQSFQWIFKVDFLKGWLVCLLAIQGTLKSLLQHYSLKASILWCPAFFMV